MGKHTKPQDLERAVKREVRRYDRRKALVSLAEGMAGAGIMAAAQVLAAVQLDADVSLKQLAAMAGQAFLTGAIAYLRRRMASMKES